MKSFLPLLLLIVMAGTAVSGPPEPSIPPLPPEKSLEETRAIMDSLKKELGKTTDLFNKRLKDIRERLDKGLEISKIAIQGDSIIITLSNDSVLVFSDTTSESAGSSGKDVLHVGGITVIEEDQVVEGDIVSVFGDVTVKGTVEGGVLALSGNIYVASTGYIKDGAIALSGKVKQEKGARIGTMVFGANYPTERLDFFEENRPYRIMGFVLFLIYVIWVILAATGASIFRKNVSNVMEVVRADAVISYFKGYLTYLLIAVAFVVLSITIVGLPLALLGLPIATIGAMILSFTAISNILGQKILRTGEVSFKTFFYGGMAMAAVPGLFFLILMLSGSLVVMIFSWIFVFAFLAVIVPIGLGAVLSTRFGTRLPEKLIEKNKIVQEAG